MKAQKNKNVKGEFKVDFIGVGMPKCGTTWIAEILAEHPDIFIPPKKEINYFNETYFGVYRKLAYNYNRGFDWYKKQFLGYKNEKITGTFNVTYFTDKKAPQRIKEHFPDAKIIVSLRNPVDMLQSFYWMFRRTSLENYRSRSFSEAIDKNIKKDLYLELGEYSKYLERYYNIFGKKNVHVIIFSDIKKNPLKVCKDLYKYLEVDVDFVPKKLNKRINKPVKERSVLIKRFVGLILTFIRKLQLRPVYVFLLNNKFLNNLYAKINYVRYEYPKIDNKKRMMLLDYYKDDIKKLSKMIDRDLESIWFD